MPEPNKWLGSNPGPCTYCLGQIIHLCVSAFLLVKGALRTLSMGAGMVSLNKINSLEQCLLYCKCSTVNSYYYSHETGTLYIFIEALWLWTNGHQ